MEVHNSDDANIAAGVDKAFEHKQVTVAVHDAVGIVSDRSADNHSVVRIAANLRGGSSILNAFHIREHKLNDNKLC